MQQEETKIGGVITASPSASEVKHSTISWENNLRLTLRLSLGKKTHSRTDESFYLIETVNLLGIRGRLVCIH